jgi:hypothetical protein
MNDPEKLLACIVLSSALGCSFTARSPEQYRDDTATLLDSKRAAIKTCYDAALRAQAGSAGDVTVRFRIEKETGRIHDVVVDSARTTAPEPVSRCVADEIGGLVLSPGDAREGQASFVWTFKVRSGGAEGGRHGS